MSRKSDFSSSEWAHLKEAASFVGLGMIAVSGSGPIGKLRELVALSSCLTPRRVPGQFKRSELVMSLLDDFTAGTSGLLTHLIRADSHDGQSGLFSGLITARRTMLTDCEDVAILLAARCPEAEAERVKRWLLWMARTVAEASGERWLGLGRKVSDDEVSMLSQIARALGVSPVEAAPTPDELEAMLGLRPPGADGASGVGEDLESCRGSGE